MIDAVIHAINVAHSNIRESLKRVVRSPKWREVEKAHLAKHDRCAACGTTQRLNVHHVQPFHLHPELELDPTNLLTLCMDLPECHLKIGHGDNFSAYNPHVVADAARVLSHPRQRPVTEAYARMNRLK